MPVFGCVYTLHVPSTNCINAYKRTNEWMNGCGVEVVFTVKRGKTLKHGRGCYHFHMPILQSLHIRAREKGRVRVCSACDEHVQFINIIIINITCMYNRITVPCIL